MGNYLPEPKHKLIMLSGFVLSCANYLVFLTLPEPADYLVGKIYFTSGLTEWRWFSKQLGHAYQTPGFVAFLFLINLQLLCTIALVVFMFARRIVSLIFPKLEIAVERLKIWLLLVTLTVLGSYLGPLNAGVLQDDGSRISVLPTNLVVLLIAISWGTFSFMAKVNALEPRLANATPNSNPRL